jgi:hypothetical protein
MLWLSSKTENFCTNNEDSAKKHVPARESPFQISQYQLANKQFPPSDIQKTSTFTARLIFE